MDGSKTKIAIISHALGGGGAERFGGLLSFILADLGYEIHNIIMNEPQHYPYCGKLLNLAQATKAFSGFRRKFGKAKLMRKYLDENQIHVIIDNRARGLMFREWIHRRVFAGREVVYLVHSHNLENYIPENRLLAHWFYDNGKALVCVSKAIEEKLKQLYRFKHTVTIYNPVTIPASRETQAALPEKFLLFFGRFEEKVKNFTLLLDAYALSKIQEQGYQLVLMGEGPDTGFIQKTITERNLEQAVVMLPYQKDPSAVVRKARFTILTSHYEGFPMSVVESLAAGTPVVAVNCESGPNEVIRNEHNGLLVENYNVPALAEAIQRLVTDERLYQTCQKNTVASIAHLSMEAISKQWSALLNRVL